jgi:hypothetical protein
LYREFFDSNSTVVEIQNGGGGGGVEGQFLVNFGEMPEGIKANEVMKHCYIGIVFKPSKFIVTTLRGAVEEFT